MYIVTEELLDLCKILRPERVPRARLLRFSESRHIGMFFDRRPRRHGPLDNRAGGQAPNFGCLPPLVQVENVCLLYWVSGPARILEDADNVRPIGVHDF